MSHSLMKKKSYSHKSCFRYLSIFMMICCYPCLISAQENDSEKSKKYSHSIYGGPFINVQNVNSNNAVFAGFIAGWSIEINGNHTIGLEPSYKRLVNLIEVQENNYGDVLYLHLTHIGFGFSYTYAARNPVSFTFRNEISTGLSNYHFGNFQADMRTGYITFTMEPGIFTNFRITKNIFGSTGLSYKILSGSDHFLISSDQLSGLSGTFRFTVKTSI